MFVVPGGAVESELFPGLPESEMDISDNRGSFEPILRLLISYFSANLVGKLPNLLIQAI